MLDKVKLALRITTDAFDSEITGLIAAAGADLKMAGIKMPETDPFVQQAIITYCRAHFGEPDQYDRLKASYDEQKAQMMVAGSYTEFGG